MKLKHSFEMVDMGDEIIAVPVGKGTAAIHGVLKLNHEGSEILGLLKEETTEEKIKDALETKYETDADTLLEYVRDVVSKLRSSGLITD